MKILSAAFEALCITGLVGVAVLAAPYILWRELTQERRWREPKDVGLGFYEHP